MEDHIPILLQIAGRQDVSESLQELLRENRESLIDYLCREYSQENAEVIESLQ